MNNTLDKLIKIGFKKVGEWELDADNIKFNLSTIENQNILYCFVQNSNPLYIGKTSKGILKRMEQYRKPGKSQSTNTKNNTLIKEGLKNKKKIEIYCMYEFDELDIEGIHINMAAGLEDSLITYLKKNESMCWNDKSLDNLMIQGSDVMSQIKVLSDLNFVYIGRYIKDGGEVSIDVRKDVKKTERKSLVYILISGDKVKYIGKTIQGYLRPLSYHKK
jgi:predicted GIY-YIG superfamily endonuclease